MENQIILATKQLTKKYGDVTAVEQINLNVKKGRIYGLLGRNGAGKTTIMKMVLGLISISSGEVEIFGEQLTGNEKSIYTRIGSIIETPSFYSYLTGTENLEIFSRLQGTIKKNAVKSALEVVGLPYKDKKPFASYSLGMKQLASYSLGMKQRLGIANAILNEPEILILDEPTNGLDPVGIVEIRKFLQTLCHEQGKTIIISSHILSEISLLADDIGIIHDGHLLKEISMKELEEKNKKFIEIKVNSVPKTTQLLENVIKCKKYFVADKNCIEIYDESLDIEEIAKCLVCNGVGLSSLYFKHETLEDYFTSLAGGVKFE